MTATEFQNGTLDITEGWKTQTKPRSIVSHAGMTCDVCCAYYGRDRELEYAVTDSGREIRVCNSYALDENPCGMIVPAEMSEGEVRKLMEQRREWVQERDISKRYEGDRAFRA